MVTFTLLGLSVFLLLRYGLFQTTPRFVYWRSNYELPGKAVFLVKLTGSKRGQKKDGQSDKVVKVQASLIIVSFYTVNNKKKFAFVTA